MNTLLAPEKTTMEAEWSHVDMWCTELQNSWDSIMAIAHLSLYGAARPPMYLISTF